ncbi:hypothetical protein NT6N_17070 [Oceaniferula spumae]|uniref:Uncharacterized protein n=1 Tax=Oceaniferula spumae TaxID=2979115 RepID=A0AAT9FKP1_9BACT
MKSVYKLLLLAGALTGQLSADTIVLKTGVKYEGKVLSEDATSYLVQIFVTKSIKDERRIPKDQVQEIIQETDAAKDFKNLGPLTPTPNRMASDIYQGRITAAKSFLKKHPKSDEAKEVQEALDILEKEYAVISKGGVKLNGQLITASDIEANAYDVHARMIAEEFSELAAQGQHQPALRKWEVLKNEYPYSTSFIDSLPLAARVMQGYQKILQQELDTLDARLKQRQTVLSSLSENDRRRAEQTISQKQAKYATLIDQEEKELKTRWLTIDPFNEDALEYNRRSAESEHQSITKLDTSRIKMAGPTYRGAWTALANGQLEEASKLIRELKSSFRMSDKYVTPLADQLEEKENKKKAAEEKAAAEKAEQERLAKEAAEKARKEAAEAKKKPKSNKK